MSKMTSYLNNGGMSIRKMMSLNLGQIFTFTTLMSRLLLPTATGTDGDRDRRQTQIVAKKRDLANNLALA